MRKYIVYCVYYVLLLSSGIQDSFGQCMNLFSPSTDSVGWVHGSSRAHGGHYSNDTFVICNSIAGENNYLYNTIPATLYGPASTFSVSFDFTIDSNFMCSDGLTFWFFTSSLYGLGAMSKEGGALGFPDTVSGFALAFRTIGCVDEIYMKKINSNHYNWSSGSGPDTNLCTPLTHQMFLTDSQWHHCIVNYDHGYITTSFDGGALVLSGYSPIWGTGHFGFMATNGAGRSRKRLKNIQVCAGLGTPAFAADTFGTDVNRLCNGPLVTTTTRAYSPTYRIATYYGDGTHDSVTTLPAFTGGYATMSHSYAAPGTFSIKQKLYDAGSLLDSLSFTYDNIFCATLPIRFFYDANADGLYQSSESELGKPVLTEVDSNGVPIDTISSTSGFYYNAHGTIGDVYSFRVIPDSIMTTTAPGSGVIYDSLVPGVYIYPIKYFGINCISGTAFDLSLNAVIPVTGVHDQWANIYVQNDGCSPMTGTLTLNYSSKYGGAPTQISPTALSAAPGTIVWNLSGLSAGLAAPVRLHYEAEHGTVPLTIGDTVHTRMVLTPTTGDADTTNNIFIKVDTVRAGCDPNAIWVKPEGCFPSGTAPLELEYDIHFENTGNDTAHNIYVLDTLADCLDVSSLRISMASHNMYVSNWRDALGRNIVKFDFPAIKLLDSSHHGLCDGAVSYKIKTRVDLPLGAEIKNRAGIYFDVNDVVMTNEVANEIGCPETRAPATFVDGNIVMYPNPAGNELTIKTPVSNNGTVTICSSVGAVLYTQKANGSLHRIDTKDLAPGIYFVRLVDADFSAVGRFVKK